MSARPTTHDVFVSHAGEDKELVARPLSLGLRARGYSVWFDEFELKVGDGLRRTIDRGLAESRFGVVVLSQSFFEKEWPERELDGLVALETTDGRHRILPVWHGVDRGDVAGHSPVLADRFAANTDGPIEDLVDAIANALGEPGGSQAQASANPTDAGPRLSPVPKTVKLDHVLLGDEVLRLVERAVEVIFEIDELEHGVGRRTTAELFDELRDLLDALSEYSLVERDALALDLTTRLIDLAVQEGIAVLGGQYTRTLTGGGRTEAWPGVVFKAVQLTDEQRQALDVAGRRAAAKVSSSARTEQAPRWDVSDEGEAAFWISDDNNLAGSLRSTGPAAVSVTQIVVDLETGGQVTGRFRADPQTQADGGFVSMLVVEPGRKLYVHFGTTDESLGAALIGRPRVTISCSDAADETLELLSRPGGVHGGQRWLPRRGG